MKKHRINRYKKFDAKNRWRKIRNSQLQYLVWAISWCGQYLKFWQSDQRINVPENVWPIDVIDIEFYFLAKTSWKVYKRQSLVGDFLGTIIATIKRRSRQSYSRLTFPTFPLLFALDSTKHKFIVTVRSKELRQKQNRYKVLSPLSLLSQGR